MSVDKTYINQVTEFMKKGTANIKEEQSKESYSAAINSLNNAVKAMADNEEKKAMVEDAATRWANQLAFLLFREGGLTPELEKEYRALPAITEVSARVKVFQDERVARIEEINKAREEVMSTQRGIDIFQAIIGGMTKEEAEAKLEEYEKKVAEMNQSAK